MKKLFVLFVSVLLSVSCCTVKTQSQGNVPFMTRKFTAAAVKQVEATTAGGSIILTGDAGSEAKVDVFVSRNDWSVEKIKQVLNDNYTIDIKLEGGKLIAVAKQKSSFGNWNNQGLSISFKISVPRQVNSNLQTSGGSIKISGLSGSQDFKTSGGSLSVDDVSGNTRGATSGGSITVSASNDNIDLATSGGSITAKDCTGKINLATSGGSLNMSNLNGTVNAATSGGSITASNINGTLKTGTSGGSVRLTGISGNLDASTSGGSMEVSIASVSDYVRLSNSGNLSLTLPSGKGYNLKVRANKVETSGLKDFRGSMESRNIDGTVGIGGAEINVRSSQRVRLAFD